MIRALTALIGFALAGAILYFVPDAGNVIDNPVWAVPLVWAGAGLVAGVFYQSGGLRRPGMRVNVPMLLLVFVPWTVVAASLVAFSTGSPAWLGDEAQSIAGVDVLNRLIPSLAVFAFVSGLLLALSLIEPRTMTVIEERVADEDTAVATRETVDDDATIVHEPART